MAGMGGGTAGATGTGGGVGPGGASGQGGAGGASGPIEFSTYVKDLILNHTTSTGTPDTINDKTFTDAMDPAAFSSLFP